MDRETVIRLAREAGFLADDVMPNSWMVCPHEAIQRFAAAVEANCVPPGWKVVPIEPTEAMAASGWDDAVEHEAENIDIYDIAGIYRAMIAAAPAPKEES